MSFNKTRITVLGCGTSTGVPLIGCSCRVCRSKSPKNRRLRASLWVQTAGKSFLVDVSPDFRQQALIHRIARVDAILMTHPHADHIGGLDEIRSYNFIQKASIPLYGHEWTLTDVKNRFAYMFGGAIVEGGGVARLSLHEFDLRQERFEVQGVEVIPLELQHGSLKVAGFRIHEFAYLTDCHLIPESTLKKLKGLEVVILDCLRIAPHSTHLHLEASLEYAKKIGAKRTYLTHLSHDFDYQKDRKHLPKSVHFAYDGLTVEASSGSSSTRKRVQ